MTRQRGGVSCALAWAIRSFEDPVLPSDLDLCRRLIERLVHMSVLEVAPGLFRACGTGAFTADWLRASPQDALLDLVGAIFGGNWKAEIEEDVGVLTVTVMLARAHA
jgi:hypothetical protein